MPVHTLDDYKYKDLDDHKSKKRVHLVHSGEPIGNIETLGRPRDGRAREHDGSSRLQAKQILFQLAKHVKPLMRRHSLTVPVLREMAPEAAKLDGTTMGYNVSRVDGSVRQCIEIRVTLRQYGNEHCFLPYKEILDIMLHELAHNTYCGHPPVFWRLFKQYQREMAELTRTGRISGKSGSPGQGHNTGGPTQGPWEGPGRVLGHGPTGDKTCERRVPWGVMLAIAAAVYIFTSAGRASKPRPRRRHDRRSGRRGKGALWEW